MVRDLTASLRKGKQTHTLTLRISVPDRYRNTCLALAVLSIICSTSRFTFC